MRRALSFVGICTVSAVLACSSSSSTPCNQNPWECPSGQTCWPDTQSTFKCLNSGPGQIGNACMDTVGTATCGDGLACLQTGASSGACTPYCSNTDPNHACPSGLLCGNYMTSAGTVQVCANVFASTDGGQASSSSSSDAGQTSGSSSSDAQSMSASSDGAASHAEDAGSDASAPDSGVVDSGLGLSF